MKEVKIIIISSLILFLGCKNKIADTSSQEKNSVDSVIVENAKDKAEIKDYANTQSFKNCNDTFDEFFERFSRDSVLQKNRIKYPLKESYIEGLESTKIKVDTVNSASEYNYINFTEDKHAMDKEYGKYKIEIEQINNTTIYYKNVGYDNGIYVIYKFKLIEGCWYMIEIEDKSA